MARRSRVPAALLGATLAALSGCACDSVPADAVEDCGALVSPGGVATDILFVIDDSASMREEQDLLAAGLEQFIQRLDASPIANSFQIGVTTTAVQDFGGSTSYVGGPPYPAGTLVAVEQDANGNALEGRFVHDGAAYGGRRILSSESPTLVTDFRANVRVGIAGPRREQPFDAARLAVEKSGPGGTNAGFLRPGARLAVVFLSDEDDCSGAPDASVTQTSCGVGKEQVEPLLVPVSDPASAERRGFAEFLAGPLPSVGGAPRDVVVAAIVGVAPGTATPSCGADHCADKLCGTALDKGDRFVALLDALGPERTRIASICDGTFGDALAGIADVIMPTTLPLDGAPADWRMLVVAVERHGVGRIGCVVAPSEAPAGADAIYEAPQPGRPATLRLQGNCELRQGDRVDVNVICAR